MILNIDFDRAKDKFYLKLEDCASEYDLSNFRHFIVEYCDAPVFIDNIICLDRHVFIGAYNEIGAYLRNHRESIKVFLSNEAKYIIGEIKEKSYAFAKSLSKNTPEKIFAKLNNAGFLRNLTNNQFDNIAKISHLPAAATFSVPGAGKTTEALAYFFINAGESDHLLVVSPLNAMGAWDEQIEACCPNKKYHFVRLRGGVINIEKLLENNPKFLIITYQQLVTAFSLLRSYMLTHDVFMFLDESHRIKNGNYGVITQNILKLSSLPKRKLIMSGTPCPQSLSDLIPQFSFLYPEKIVPKESITEVFHSFFVRTTKNQLEIPPICSKVVSLDMEPIQAEVYNRLRSELSRSQLPISKSAKSALRRLGSKIFKIVEFVSNPSLLAPDMNFIFNQTIGNVLANNCGPKITFACQRARELAAEGHKVIIWSQFVRNVLLITERLKDLGADCIYGNVSSGDENEEDTREGIIKQFHVNPDKKVLVLNPSAASEAISLHTVCKHAIYVDRSFNAAHYLQSQDRIHRLGITESPVIEILQCKNSIDEVINNRLIAKIQIMSDALNDPSLNTESIPYDCDDIDPSYNYDGISPEDINAVLSFFRTGN